MYLLYFRAVKAFGDILLFHHQKSWFLSFITSLVSYGVNTIYTHNSSMCMLQQNDINSGLLMLLLSLLLFCNKDHLIIETSSISKQNFINLAFHSNSKTMNYLLKIPTQGY